MARQTKEEIAAKQRAYNLVHREEIAAQKKKYEAAHRDEIATRQAEYRKANPEKKTAQRRAYADSHRAEEAARKRAYAATHQEEIAKRKKAWRAARRPETAAYKAARREQTATEWHNRNAKKHGSEGTHTADEWRAMLDWFGRVCLCCGGTNDLTRDHVVPTTEGGSNWISNLQPLCRSCNTRKQVKTIDYRDPAHLALFLESLAKS